MKHLPNLLKQESSSAATLVHILCRMYYDPRPEHQAAKPQIADRLMPLGRGVLQDYNKLRGDTQAKNIAAWTPVVAEILHGFCRFEDRAVGIVSISISLEHVLTLLQFQRYLPAIYPLVVDLLSRDVSPDVRMSARNFFARVGVAQGFMDRDA
jgi:brefeldin A-inhibited guanine nucleotide-exchange protein